MYCYSMYHRRHRASSNKLDPRKTFKTVKQECIAFLLVLVTTEIYSNLQKYTLTYYLAFIRLTNVREEARGRHQGGI